MKTQGKINMETLIPSSLLEEELSDNESITKIKFEDNIPNLKDASQEKEQEKVFHIFNLFIIYIYYRAKMLLH